MNMEKDENNKTNSRLSPDEMEWNRDTFRFPKSSIVESSFKTPTWVQWFIGLCVLLFAMLFFLGQLLLPDKSEIYLVVSSVSVLIIAFFGLFSLSKLTKQTRHLRLLLNIDRTTGLYGSTFLMEKLDRLIDEAGHELVLIFLDLDELKEFNDKFGHRRGDILIRNAADILSKTVAGKGMGFRCGGDEFVAMLTDISSEEAVELAKSVHESFVEKGISASIGVYQWRKGMSADKLLYEADQAMYKAKRAGKGKLFIPDIGSYGNADDLDGEFIE
jgi:diguanylate cyclase (GGDEF)-like protein